MMKLNDNPYIIQVSTTLNNCGELDKVAMDVLEGLEYYLSGLNYNDEGKTLKFKIKDVISSVIIDNIDFKEV